MEGKKSRRNRMEEK
jgi:hypothetical protein